MNDTRKPTGLTRDTGWQIGVRRTLPVSLETAWDLLTSPAGIQLWLGAAPELTLAAGTSYRLANGTSGEVTVFKPRSHLRLTWQPSGWQRPAIMQVRVIASGERTVIAFHQEHLPDAAAREERRAHFAAVLDQLEQRLQNET